MWVVEYKDYTAKNRAKGMYIHNQANTTLKQSDFFFWNKEYYFFFIFWC